MDGPQGHAPTGHPTHRQTGITPLHIRQRTRRHACQTPEHQPHPRARTCTTGYPTPQPPATPTPDTLGHTTPPNGCPRTRCTQIETSSTTTPHPSSSWPPHWATRRTPNSSDASKTPSTPPSTTPPYARSASQHTYKNPDSNSPSNSFPSSPDTTDGTHADRSTSPQDTPNASVATRKKKPGTTSKGAPCTEDWTPSRTGTQPTPSHSTPDGRRGPRQPSDSPPSSSRRRYSRRSAGDSSPQPSTPCYAPTRRTPKPQRHTCNGRPLPRQRNSSHTAPTGTCSMQQPYPKQTKPTSSNSCSSNHENLPHERTKTGPPPRLHTIHRAQHWHGTHRHHRHHTHAHQRARAASPHPPTPPSVHRYHQPPATA